MMTTALIRSHEEQTCSMSRGRLPSIYLLLFHFHFLPCDQVGVHTVGMVVVDPVMMTALIQVMSRANMPNVKREVVLLN